MPINNFGIRKLNGKRAKRTDDHNVNGDCKYQLETLRDHPRST